MKKITFLLSFLTVAAVSTAQEQQVSDLGENNPNIIIEQTINRAPCDLSNGSNAFENGASNTQNLGRVVANDIVTAAGENLTLEELTIFQFQGPTGGGVMSVAVDFYIYEDDGGMPGAELASELGLVPTSQTVVGNNFGFDVYQLDIDVTDILLEGDVDDPVTYWIGISNETSDASNTFWENSTAGVVGEPSYYNDGVVGFVEQPGLESVYTFSGDCEAILGVNDELLSQVSVFPNPAREILNINVPSTVEINGVTLYDVLGKAATTTISNGQINVSNLARGVYILNVDTTAGTLTDKVVIE